MKNTISFCFLILGTLSACAAGSGMTITSNPGVSVTASLSLPVFNGEEGPVTSSFTFQTGKGLLGPTSNPSDQSGFSNTAKDLFAVTVIPATKSGYVHLFLKQPKGGILFINDINTRIAQLLPAPWNKYAKFFLRIEKIKGRKIVNVCRGSTGR